MFYIFVRGFLIYDLFLLSRFCVGQDSPILGFISLFFFAPLLLTFSAIFWNWNVSCFSSFTYVFWGCFVKHLVWQSTPDADTCMNAIVTWDFYLFWNFGSFIFIQALVEKDWLAFGHPFSERTGMPTVSGSGISFELSRQSSAGSFPSSPMRQSSGSLASQAPSSSHAQNSNNYSPIFLQVCTLILNLGSQKLSFHRTVTRTIKSKMLGQDSEMLLNPNRPNPSLRDLGETKRGPWPWCFLFFLISLSAFIY